MHWLETLDEKHEVLSSKPGGITKVMALVIEFVVVLLGGSKDWLAVASNRFGQQ